MSPPDPCGDPDSGPRAPRPGLHHFLVVALALGALVFAWCGMSAISRSDPWYRNTDMNIHNLVDALALNSDLAPNLFTQPGLPLKYLLALDYRVRHYTGRLSVWNMKKFSDSPDLLAEIRNLVRIERVHSRMLVIALIVAAAALVYAVTGRIEPAGLAAILLCGSPGLLFQGLLIRPELLCVFLGNVLALLCVWRATCGRGRPHGWLFLSGFLCGMSALEKLPGAGYLGLCYAWCWLSALTSGPAGRANTTPAKPASFWWGLLPAAAGAATLWLLMQLGDFHDKLGAEVLWRLRVVAMVVAVTPLLLGETGPIRGRFFRERMRELVLLAGGALAALPCGYLLVRGILSKEPAASYMTGVLHFLVNPAPYMKTLLSEKPDTYAQFIISLGESPLLFGSTTLLTLGVALVRGIPLRLRSLIALLWLTALGLTWLMSRRHFAAQYSIFSQVPLLLVWALGLHALVSCWQKEGTPKEAVHWAVPLALTAALVLTLTAYPRVWQKYTRFQDDANLPVNELTLTFLFDHDAHAGAYLQTMKDRYGTRENFARSLDKYLAEPANRF